MAKPRAAEAPVAPPPWYEATADLYVFHPEGAAPACAFRAGDTHVPPDLVEQWGWQDSVRVPEIFAGAAEPNANAPDSQDVSSGGPGPEDASAAAEDTVNGDAAAEPDIKAARAAEEG